MMRNPSRWAGEGHDDRQTGIRCLAVAVWFSALMTAMAFSYYAIILLPLAVIATLLSGRSPDFFGLILCHLMSLSFSYFFSLGSIPNIVLVVRVLLLLSLAVVCYRNRSADFEYRKAAFWFGLFIVTTAVSSFRSSMYVGISEAKILFYGLFIGGLLLGARPSSGFPNVTLGVVGAIGFLSLFCYLFFPFIGYAFVLDPNAGREAAGKFSGIMNHPQLLAAILAVNLPLMLYAYVHKKGLVSWLGIGAFLASLALIAFSSSRTGLLASMVSCSCALYFFQKHAVSPKVKARGNSVAIGLFLVVCIGSIFAMDEVKSFIYKSGESGEGLSLSGRDKIIAASWDGFMDKPFFGNGFQVPSDFTEHGSASFGLTSDSTSVEKCFFITALLEEVGLVGTTLFLAMLWALISHWRRKGSFVSIAALFSFLMINTGEACILSPSSVGGLCWLSIFAVHNLRLTAQPSSS